MLPDVHGRRQTMRQKPANDALHEREARCRSMDRRGGTARAVTLTVVAAFALGAPFGFLLLAFRVTGVWRRLFSLVYRINLKRARCCRNSSHV